MKNILWLVSWYPNRYDASLGNFIQRQAKAVSLYANIHVLYVHEVETEIKSDIEEENRRNGNLTEQIIYYRKKSKSIFGKLNSLNQYYFISKNAIENYITKNGLPDYVHVQVPVRAGTIALWMKRKYKINFALTEHYGIYNTVAEDHFGTRSFFYRNTVRKISKNASPLICVSNQLGNEINQTAIKKDFITIPNVVDTTLFHFEKQKGKNSRFRFLHVSNMIPLKNVEGIIDAAKLLYTKRNDFELKIIGRTPTHILKYAEQSGLLNKIIFFSGEIPYEQVATEMQNANSFILNSRSESASCVLQESLCCGLPVISTPVGIASETINEKNGLLINISDSVSLSEKMNEQINTYSKYNREEIAKSFSNQFSYAEVGKRIFDAYKF
ncbi:MAG: glycosyltransferase [Bacteroidota bacterium]